MRDANRLLDLLGRRPRVHEKRWGQGNLLEMIGGNERCADMRFDGGAGEQVQSKLFDRRHKYRECRAHRRSRAASSLANVLRVEASAIPSTRAGRKWRWNAATTSRVCASQVPLAAMP